MSTRRPQGVRRATTERPLPIHLQLDMLPDPLCDAVVQIMTKYRRLCTALDYPVGFDAEGNGQMHVELHEAIAERYIDWLLDTIEPYDLWHVDTAVLKERYRGSADQPMTLDPGETMIEVGAVFDRGLGRASNLRVFATMVELMGRLVPAFGACWQSHGRDGLDITAPPPAAVRLGADGNVVALRMLPRRTA